MHVNSSRMIFNGRRAEQQRQICILNVRRDVCYFICSFSSLNKKTLYSTNKTRWVALPDFVTSALVSSVHFSAL